MKTYFNFKYMAIATVFAASSLSLTSCDDFLDLKPTGTFTEEQLDDSSIEGLMASAYAGLEAHFFGNNESFAGPITNWVFDVRSDDALKGGGDITMEQYIHQLEVSNVTSDNAVALDKWRNNYYAISRVHKAMNAIENSNIANKATYLGELKLLRAYFYFDLIRIFKQVPYFTENEDPNGKRADEYTRDQIFSFIKQDLVDAYSVLPEEQSQAGRFNKYVAAAVMAKVSAFTSNWSDVETYANYVIASNKYDFYDNYGDMSKIEFNNKKESVMAVQFSTANNNAHINWSNLLNTTYSEGALFGTGDDFFLGSQNLVDAFATDNNGLPYLDGSDHYVKTTENGDGNYDGNVDPRLDFTVGRLGMPFRGHTYNKKWCRAYDIYGEYSGKKGLIDPSSPDMVQGFPWGASALNYCIIRYSDIVLLKAEALIEQNKQLDEARTLINDVRKKAQRSIDGNYTPQDLDPFNANYNVGLYPSEGWTQEYARKAVRMERRLELAMEGNRWFDLLRWNTAVSTVNAYMQSEQRYHTYYAGNSISEDELYFSVPYEEVNNSNGLYK
ncbi:MAG: RagB/SusD family nutrient uptake outer membrane protein [Prevotella sp.]|uniref:RagB/SusD family nutrient uptake outer membrane protein n=1 Tax=Prevotella sp. TaxID=59823 RepID=UPI0025F384BA|nr:RagB/SusD family nutrient uptake outer membrane protein [Prevotella sp.]MCI7120178.1 RagB/SusD family nutrient uptake outer membrane protein [Prevotella sp.]